MTRREMESIFNLLKGLGYDHTAELLEQHDTAQRETLARAEAERDNARCVVADLLLERDTTQAQLAEALWHLDGVLNNLPEDLSHRFGGSRSFLARHAQAERTAVTEYIGPHGQELLEHIKVEQKEAQGPMAKMAEGLRQKAADEWASHPSNPANQEAQARLKEIDEHIARAQAGEGNQHEPS